MSITVKETRRSRSRTLETEEREYIAWGSDDPSDIESAVFTFDTANSPPSGLVVTAYSQEPHEEDESVFDARVSYGQFEPREPTETGGSELSFELSMVTSTIKQGLERIAAYGTDPPDLPGIGWDGEQYGGTDIQIPVFSFRKTVFRPIANLTLTYINQLMQCAASPINDAPFMQFEAGEVMYIGASGSQRSADDFAITHAFAASPNLTELSVGAIDGIAKNGWEFLWTLYEKEEDTTNKWVTEKPRAVYVDRVYNSSSFSTLLEI
jgi:hypothetical protein